MILVGVGNQNAIDGSLNVERFREKSGRLFRCIKGPTYVEKDTAVTGGKFDAVAADLICCAMDGQGQTAQADSPQTSRWPVTEVCMSIFAAASLTACVSCQA